MKIQQVGIADIIARYKRTPNRQPQFTWIEGIDIDFVFAEQVSPGTEPGNSGTDPLTREQ